MLTSQGLTAYTLRLYAKHTDDSDLETVFGLAAEHSPAVVLLEDLDRAFPCTGRSDSKVQLQTLLNALDGVATEPGVVTVATANEPSLLDAAILRRPGRFDRVIHFTSPDAELRREYLLRMHAPLAGQDLAAAVEASAGFSYALLQENYILAAQTARFEARTMTAADLAAAAGALRRGYKGAGGKGSAGFTGFDISKGAPPWTAT